MAKAKSQWDFGELFPREEARAVLTVTDLTGQIRRLLEKQVGPVWVSGEIANLRAQSSGHIYFTLKDSTCQLSCVLFRGEARTTRDLLADGQLPVEVEFEAPTLSQFPIASVEQAGARVV